MKAIRYEKDTVLIQDGKVKAWVDVWIENKDVICDWNRNDFVMTDSNDVALKNWQTTEKYHITKGSILIK